MLPKTHLTSHSRMSGSGWVTTPSWLSRSSRLFLCSSSMYSFQLFLISFASVKSLPFLSVYHAHPCMKCSLDISSFAEEISSLFYCFPLLLCIVHLRRSAYLCSILSETLPSIGYILPFLLCLSLLFFPQLFVRPPQTTTLCSFVSFSLGWLWSPYKGGYMADVCLAL